MWVLCIMLAACTAGEPTSIDYRTSDVFGPKVPKWDLKQNSDPKLNALALEPEEALTYEALPPDPPIVVEELSPPPEKVEKPAVAAPAPAVAPQDVVRVALLIPMSGAYGDLGQHLMDAASLALFHINRAELQLMPYDTKGTPEGAVAAINEALIEKPDVVIGPLLKSSVEAIVPIVKKQRVITIAFSNAKEMADKGIYLLGFRPEQQIARVIDYAKTQKMEIFYGLVPMGDYGDATVSAAAKALAPEAVLDGREADPNEAVLEDVFRYEGEGESLSQGVEALISIAQQAKDSEANSVGVIIPEGGRSLLTIANRLKRRGAETERYRLLGSGAWDDAVTLTNERLLGSWFASSPPGPRLFFEESYKKMYGNTPPRIASLSYDAMALVSTIAMEKGGFTRKAIESKRGFYGVNGAFRFTDDTIAQRALAVLEITEDGFMVVDPAPESFSFF